MNCRQAICVIVCNIQQYRWPPRQLETIMVLSLGIRSLSIFKGALLPNFNKIVQRDLVMELSNSKHIFSTVAMNVQHVWLNVLHLGTNVVCWGITVFSF